LYQGKNRWQNARASSRLPKRSGKSGRYFSVLNGSVAWVEGEVRQALPMRRRPDPVPPQSGFAGFRFPRDVILVAVRWYLRYGLSYRDVEEVLAERGVTVDHVTIYRWVQRFTPLLRPCRHVRGIDGS
jgi:hypothetical protein